MNDLQRLQAYDEELSKEMPTDFKDWWENSKDEWPVVARLVLEGRRRERDLYEQMVLNLSEHSAKQDLRIKELEVEVERLEVLAWEATAGAD
jgi:cephalosporin-C deacetylase-like acetyl esterase